MSEQRHGYFGSFGGQFMPETLMNAVIELEEAYNKYKDDPEFVRELEDLHKKYTGRPSLLYYAERMTKDLGGAKIYLKREDLNHTGSHKLNNVLVKCYWQNGWVKSALSLRLVQANTVLQLRLLRH